MKIKNFKKILSCIKHRLKNYYLYCENKKTIVVKDCADVAIMGTPAYGNLGDQLIAFAEIEFLKHFYPDRHIVEISENDIRFRLYEIKKIIRSDTVIYLQGGGNIGDIWIDQEKIRDVVIASFPDNKIIVMPQTIYFSDLSIAYKFFAKYKRSIVVCAREKHTFEILSDNDIRAYLCPDMAFFLLDHCEKYRKNNDRESIGICMRDDREGIYKGAKEQILKYLEENEMTGCLFSTVMDGFFTVSDREYEVDRILKYICTKEMIITDRLHAMIMAYLTDTPCIVYANSNKKIEGTYEWIKDVDNIYFTYDIMDGLAHINEIIGKHNINHCNFYKEFNGILNLI